MDWRDQGICLNVRRHGETSAIVEALTRDHGRHVGVVRGGVSRKLTPILQPGALLDLTWRARLSEHIGSYSVEPIRSSAGAILSDRLGLAGLNAVTALLAFCLPEREAHPRLFEATLALIEVIGDEGWPVAYLQWEVALLSELGFALDLSRCASTGAVDDLVFVSPKSGRAVSRQGAKGYEDRLLPLPDILADARNGDPRGVVQGLTTTGYFLSEKLAGPHAGRPLPAARQRLCDLLARVG